MKPPHPADERRRLEVLRDYGILDTPADPELDALTRLAAHVCRTPIALISLVDEHRQWFKSRVGLEAREAHGDLSFCNHAILSPQLLLVTDATADPRFASSPFVTGPTAVRFYAGVPLVSPEQEVLGTLCVLDRQPRSLSEHQQESLHQITALVQARLNQHRQLQKSDVRTQQTIKLARTVVELETEIHRRRRAEEESRRYADMVQNIQLGLLVWRLEEPPKPASLRLVAINPAASRASGMPFDVLVGKLIGEVYPKLMDTDIPQRYVDVINRGAPADLGLVTYEDERIPRRDFRVRAFPLPDQSVGVAFENVTDQRILEQAQLENQARKAAILDSAPDAIVTIDFEGRIFEWNPAAERIFGHRRQFVLAKELAALVFTDASRDRFRTALAASLHSAEGPLLGRRLEMSARRADGSEFPVEITVSRVAREGAPIFTSFLRDITERRRFEEALRASQGLYSSLVESLPQTVFRKDLESRFTFANTKFCSIVGRRLEQIIGRTDFDFFPDAQAQKLRDQDQQVIHSSIALETVEEMELPGLGRRHIQIVKAPICNAFGTVVGLQGMFWDITERVHLENQLRHAQKMETVGQLAGGVAHDFNNLLTVIQGHASMLIAKAPVQSDESSALQQISIAADRAAHLTRQLLTFSRKQMLQPVLLDLNDLVRRLLEMLQRTVGESIAVHPNLHEGLPVVQADPVMLEQVLINLAANARDAMPQGGELVVTTSSTILKAEDLPQHPEAAPGPYNCITVADTGTGISPEHLPHIFEPFFTTKEVGRGTGLGLATVYGIVKQHHGWITVDSAPGRGTNFQIYLPAGPSTRTKKATPATEVKPGRGGKETILVVEDDAPLRTLVRRILESNGYTILEAPSGRVALEIWKQHAGCIDLLLTDMVMPDGINGRDLALQLQSQRPTLQVLYTTGYSADIIGIPFILEEGVNFLPKPYAPRQLADTVRNCLDQRPPLDA